MIKDIFGKTLITFLAMAALFAAAADGVAQNRDDVKPPPQTLSLAETQEWLAGAIGKYASYKTRVTTVTVSNAKFEGCTLSFAQTRRSGSTSTATMGATRTSNVVKDEISFDTAQLSGDGITVTDHIYPELQTIEIRLGGAASGEDSKVASGGRVVEMVVKRESSSAIKTAILQVGRLCTAKN